MTKQPWQKRAAQTDFDPQGRAQARVWTRLQERPSHAWKRSVTWGMCAAVLLVLGAVAGARWSAKEYTAPRAANGAQMLQCKKTGSQFLLSAEIQCDGKNCSCTKKWTDCTCTDSPCVHRYRNLAGRKFKNSISRAGRLPDPMLGVLND